MCKWLCLFIILRVLGQNVMRVVRAVAEWLSHLRGLQAGSCGIADAGTWRGSLHSKLLERPKTGESEVA